MIRFTWSDSAKTDLRRVEKNQALGIRKALARFGREGVGDVKSLSMTSRGVIDFASEAGECSFDSKPTAPYMWWELENRKDAYHS